MKKIFLLGLMIGLHTTLFSQEGLRMYFGGNTSNVIHHRQNQQILYGHTLNAPLWNYGFQIGTNKIFKINNVLELEAGLKFQLRGDKKSALEIFPDNEHHSIRFYYALLPINLRYRLLKTSDIYFKAGPSLDYLLIQNEVEDGVRYFPEADSFGDKIGLTGQVGFEIPFTKNIATELMYSQSLTDIIKFEFTNESLNRGYKHQAFEFSLIIKI